MLKNESLTAASFVFSILAIIFSITKINFSPSTDTFIGIMAGLIGICATIMVGFQIFNSIDTRNKLQEIEKLQHSLKKELTEAKEERDKNELTIKAQIERASGLALHVSQPYSSYVKFYSELTYYLKANNVHGVHQAIRDLNVLRRQLEDTTRIPSSKDINDINRLSSDQIDQYDLFLLVKNDFEKIHTEVLELIEKNKEKWNG